MSDERTPLVFHPSTSFSGEKQGPPPYGVVQVNHYIHDYTRPPKSGETLSIPVLVLLGIGVALVVAFGFTLFWSRGISSSSNALNEEAPNDNTNLNPSYNDITIPQGRLRGFTKKSRQGRDYTAYYKIPYAEPPLNELRFKDPIPPRNNWEGLRSIPDVAPQCIQKEKYSDIDEAVGEEDCLYANIYVPFTSKTNLLPVMVYIHGGAFVSGNGSRYGAEYFMDEDVVLITFQYRLGPLGFINTGDDVIPGNMGLKDQVQMLRWTKENAKYFGGDPNKVTIFGNSGGAISASFLMVSPMARGLFHRAISQSGANVCAGIRNFGMLDLNPSETITEMGRVLNCDTGSSSIFLECLKTKSAAEIALVRTPPTRYVLTVEHRNDDQVFMPDTPYNLAKTDPIAVPYIIGIVNGEWAGQGLNLMYSEELSGQLNKDFGGNGREVLNLEMNEDDLLKVRDFYFGDKKIGNDTIWEAINLMSDKGLIHCSYVSAHMHSEHSPTYLYYLSKPPYLSYLDKTVKGFPAKEMGIVSHADELQFFFPYYGYPEIGVDDLEYYEFSRYLVKQWANFAADGSPSSDWQRVSGNTSNSTFWFELNDKPGQTQTVRDRMEFLDQFTHRQLTYE